MDYRRRSAAAKCYNVLSILGNVYIKKMIWAWKNMIMLSASRDQSPNSISLDYGGPAELYRVYHIFGRPVLAVPANFQRLRLNAWQRYQPFTLKRAMVRWFMHLSTMVYADRLFSRLVTNPLAFNDPNGFQVWLEQVCQKIGSPNAQPVIVWPPQKNRGRVYVHLINPDGLPVGFAKVSFDERNDEQLRTEASKLRSLSASKLTTCYTPEVLNEGIFQGRRYFVEEPLPDKTRPLPATPIFYPRSCVDEWGGCIWMAKPEEVEAFTWWRRVSQGVAESSQAFFEELKRLIRIEPGLPVRQVHGDLGAANLVLVDGRLWVLDWEESASDGPELADEIGYDLSVHAKALKRRPEKELRRFFLQHLRGSSPEKRRDIMAAMAFRKAIDPPNVDVYIQNWFAMTTMQES